MATKNRTPKDPDDGSATPGNDTPRKPPRRNKPTLGNPGADPQRIHREYVEQHTGGGEEPTPEAYERGLEQWHRLPGAVARPPAEVRVRAEGDATGDAPDADEPTAETGATGSTGGSGTAGEGTTTGDEEADEVDGSPS